MVNGCFNTGGGGDLRRPPPERAAAQVGKAEEKAPPGEAAGRDERRGLCVGSRRSRFNQRGESQGGARAKRPGGEGKETGRDPARRAREILGGPPSRALGGRPGGRCAQRGQREPTLCLRVTSLVPQQPGQARGTGAEPAAKRGGTAGWALLQKPREGFQSPSPKRPVPACSGPGAAQERRSTGADPGHLQRAGRGRAPRLALRGRSTHGWPRGGRQEQLLGQ